MKKPLRDVELREVEVNGERFVSEQTLIDSLAYIYIHEGYSQIHIADLCDGHLDHSGRLLGKIRDSAAS